MLEIGFGLVGAAEFWVVVGGAESRVVVLQC